MKTFVTGVNLGGWISQYAKLDSVHFDTFIQEADIAQIASWGMDHVRLPVDYPVLESDEAPGVYLEAGFKHIDDCLSWCQKYGLKLILDIHKAPGFSFTYTLQEETKHLNTLFDDAAMQERFINLWAFMAKRYLQYREMLVFELMNELVVPDSEPWNDLAGKLIDAIRALDPERDILVGGNHFNAVSELKNIRRFDDAHVHYTFHYYDPHIFTHQKAYWENFLRTFDQTVEYPGQVEGVEEFLGKHPEFTEDANNMRPLNLTKELIEMGLQPAFDFMKETGLPLYCGEFGVIENAPVESSLRWHRDLLDIFTKNGIGGAVWTYKLMDFGLVDGDGKPVSPELIKIVSRK